MNPLLIDASGAATSARDQAQAGHPVTALVQLSQAVYVLCQYLDQMGVGTGASTPTPSGFVPMPPEGGGGGGG
jgi:hypothetical protein